MPQGSTIHKHRSDGYQEALTDVLAKFIEGGPAAALQWIEDNTHHDDTRHTARRLRALEEGRTS